MAREWSISVDERLDIWIEEADAYVYWFEAECRFLDAPMQNEDGTPSHSLRADLAAATEPTLLHRWD